MSDIDRELVIWPDGTAVAIHEDRLAPVLAALGRVAVARASHVEPVLVDGEMRGWQADLSPVNGPVLGPFTTRQEALELERIWLEEALRRGPHTIALARAQVRDGGKEG
ncbi:hypothetical protein [Nitrospira calida]|jgi:hypothetical protein